MKRAYLTILAAFGWLILGGLAGVGLVAATTDPKAKDVPTWVAVLLAAYLLTFAAIFLLGTARWASAKGYAGWMGVALGWAGPLGLLLLACLPARVERT